MQSTIILPSIFREFNSLDQKNKDEGDNIILALLSPLIAMIAGGLLACYFG